jgi:hypothetical protein
VETESSLRSAQAQLVRLNEELKHRTAGETASPVASDAAVADEERSALLHELASSRAAAARACEAQAEAETCHAEALSHVECAEAARRSADETARAAQEELRSLRTELRAASEAQASLEALLAEDRSARVQAQTDAEASAPAAPAPAMSRPDAAAEARIARLESTQSRLLSELDAQASELEAVYDSLCSERLAHKTATADAQSLAVQNARLREMLLEQNAYAAPSSTARSDNDAVTHAADAQAAADELDALRADRGALQQALQQAARREAEMERQLATCAVPADGQRALPTVAVLAAIEGRLRKLQTEHHM